MELYEQMRKISFIFFVVLGVVHFWTGLLLVNGYYPPYSGIANRISFIPFVVTMMIYVFASLKKRLMELGKDAKWVTYAGAIFGGIVFLGLLAAELLVVDSPCPLTACPV